MTQSKCTQEELLAEVARTINELDRITGLELAVEVGQLVLDTLFEGDLTRLARRDLREPLVRALGAHPELGLDPPGLERVMKIFETIDGLGGVEACQHLSAHHIRAVLSMHEPGRLELLQLAEQHGWTVGELEQAAQAMAGGWSPPRPQAALPAPAPAAA